MQTKASIHDTVSERERKNRTLAFEAAAEGIVLLENDGVLPLAPCSLALYGAGAAYTIQGGSGSGEVNVRHAASALEGLEAAGFTITTKDWIDRYDALWKQGREAFLREHRKKLRRLSAKVLAELMAAEYRYPAGGRITEQEISACRAEACVYVLSRQSGEGHDRRDEAGSFRLDETETHNIRLCAERFDRFVLVINSGAPVDLTPLDGMDGLNAVIYMNQLGMEGGRALSAVLTGERTPSGKLAVTWPASFRDVPFGDEFGIPGENRARYKEGIFVGYRWYDSFGVRPRYPFGFGKSYTAFSVETTRVSLNGAEALVSVGVTNTGKTFSGKAVVQIYVSCPQGELKKEYQRLAAFGKTRLLAPGERDTLTLRVPLEALASYDEGNAETVLEAGEYVVRVGASSRETTPAARLTLPQHTVLSCHRNLCAAGEPICELHVPELPAEAMPADLPTLPIDPGVFRTVLYDYALSQEAFSERTEAFLHRFAPEDMVKFCAGTGLFGENRGFRVPGAVGHTTTDYLDLGIPNRELCDGPAGLRIQRRSTIGKKGKIKAVDASISLYEFLPGFVRRLLLGNPDQEQLLYQYVTGFPVAAAVAQTWNTALAEAIGQAVSTEMTEYGVTWWLAPAMNIVRNPLCGRNYEYYSEDPLLSGKLAAAVTRGVQATPGNYVTIKHFAANNQEENRYYVSSDLDERALREIYLRGFEIAVREARPKAVMSAYNRINGVYCANSRALCTDILRGEWGFDGIVMTDWLSTGDDRADEAGCLNASVDLIMPGGKKVVKELRNAHREGRVADDVLRLSCGRVLEQILSGL
jgi:beta-glucosidase